MLKKLRRLFKKTDEIAVMEAVDEMKRILGNEYEGFPIGTKKAAISIAIAEYTKNLCKEAGKQLELPEKEIIKNVEMLLRYEKEKSPYYMG